MWDCGAKPKKLNKPHRSGGRPDLELETLPALSREVRAGSGEGEVTYLTGLDAVDQGGVRVPLPTPSAHNTLEEAER